MFPFEKLNEMLEASQRAIKENASMFSDLDRTGESTTSSRRLSTEGFLGLFSSPRKEPVKETKDLPDQPTSLIEASPLSASMPATSTGSLIDFEDIPKLKSKFTGNPIM